MNRNRKYILLAFILTLGLAHATKASVTIQNNVLFNKLTVYYTTQKYNAGGSMQERNQHMNIEYGDPQILTFEPDLTKPIRWIMTNEKEKRKGGINTFPAKTSKIIFYNTWYAWFDKGNKELGKKRY